MILSYSHSKSFPVCQVDGSIGTQFIESNAGLVGFGGVVGLATCLAKLSCHSPLAPLSNIIFYIPSISIHLYRQPLLTSFFGHHHHDLPINGRTRGCSLANSELRKKI